MPIGDFDPEDYADIEGLDPAIAEAWHCLCRTAGWPKPVEQEDLDQFVAVVRARGGISKPALGELCESHSGFDAQDWGMIYEEIFGEGDGD